MVIKTLNGELYASFDKEIYLLEEILVSEEKSSDFDIIESIKPVKRSIPNMNHPWRKNLLIHLF